MVPVEAEVDPPGEEDRRVAGGDALDSPGSGEPGADLERFARKHNSLIGGETIVPDYHREPP